MKNDYGKDFAFFEGKIWLNTASEGALPLISAQALQEAVEWKSKPYLLTIPRFIAVQKELKGSIGRLIDVPDRDVILGNSASHGLHILANGIPWEEGDEILLMQNDFPADILPWLALGKKGIKVRQLKPRGQVLEPDELEWNISGRTRLVCLPHVHSFSGFILEVKRMAEICRSKDVLFVLNITQSIGTMPVACSQIPVDAVVAAGYKWLCGPYGTGFAWIKPELRERLDLNLAYWPAVLSDAELQSNDVLAYKETQSARKFDVFGTANFFNFVPFRASVDYWLDVGPENVRAYHDRLIDRLIAEIDHDTFDFISPMNGGRRSSLVVLSHKDKNRNEQIRNDLMERGIFLAFWRGNLRIAPHVYNTEEEMTKVAGAMNEMGR
jgi:selenocysteine lyase/cysteine desulfurase